MREAMRSLAQGIVASYEARAAGLASIRQDVSAQRELNRRHVQELTGPRREAARTLHGHLAREHAKLARNEGRRKSGVRRWLTNLEEATAKSRDEVQASLKKFASTRRFMARHLKEDLAQGHARLRASVITQLQELDEAHNAMAQEQSDALAQADAQRRTGILGWLGELTGERLAAGQEWQQLGATMQAKRGGAVAVAEAPREVAPPPPAVRAHRRHVETPRKKKAVAIEEAGARTPRTLPERVFSYLANRPDGARLVELEREFELGRFRAAQVIQSLVSEGKAEKRDLLYFAA